MKFSMTKKKAFTLIELLIVIAIIGILFIVLVSKVDFATDKAKATGVQTDFRSFQVAIETVAKENAGLATFGWDTGDVNGDRVRNSYDAGDTNQDGIRDAGEVWTGRKVYGETWTGVYTLTNPADGSDTSAIFALETAINKNLDPKLHITIHDDYTITMANQARDPWGNEYYGYYISNAENDGKDRGAIVIFSSGANGEHGCEHDIAGGLTSVSVPGNNVQGKDDYSIATVYTYVNGYGEVKTTTTGFSNNQGNNNPELVGASSQIEMEQTYYFSEAFSNSQLAKLFNACTSDTQEDGYAILIDSYNHYIEIYEWDDGLYGIYYYDYNTDIDYDYVTPEIAAAYDDVIGWHDCYNGYELTSAPSLTFVSEDAEYVYMPNGMRDLAPLFVKHTHSYTNCVCFCGNENHTFIGNICSKCNLSDRGYYYDVVYWGQSVNYNKVDYRYFAIVFNKDDTISISRHTTYDGELYVEWDSLPIIWDEDAKTIKFKLPVDPDVHNEYVDLSMSVGRDSITWAEDYTHLYYKDEIDYIELVARYDLPVGSLPLEEPIYDQSGNIYTFHADNTVDVYDADWGDTKRYTFEWDGKSIMRFFDSNGYESSATYHLAFTGKGIFANWPS